MATLGDGVTLSEDIPVNTSNAIDIDDYIREVHVGLADRIAVEHIHPAAASAGGQHKYVTWQVQTTKPTLSSPATQIAASYVKSDGGTDYDLYFERGDGVEVKLTYVDGLNLAVANIASQAAGDIFYASSATAVARLAKGSNGDTLTLSSGVPAWTSTIGAHGAASHTDLTRYFLIPPNACYCATAASYDNNQNIITMADNADTDIYTNFILPADYSSSLVVDILWRSAAASGNIYINPFAAQWCAEDETYSNATSDPDASADATAGANKVNHTDAGYTFTGIAAGDFVSIAIKRDGDDASDTLSADALFLGFKIGYTASQ